MVGDGDSWLNWLMGGYTTQLWIWFIIFHHNLLLESDCILKWLVRLADGNMYGWDSFTNQKMCICNVYIYMCKIQWYQLGIVCVPLLLGRLQFWILSKFRYDIWIDVQLFARDLELRLKRQVATRLTTSISSVAVQPRRPWVFQREIS
jgi:hypothetical protein